MVRSPGFSHHSKQSHGFTLVEVLIALVVAMFLLLMAERVLIEMIKHERTMTRAWRRWTEIQSGHTPDITSCLYYSPYPSRIWRPEDIIWIPWEDVRLPIPCIHSNQL